MEPLTIHPRTDDRDISSIPPIAHEHGNNNAPKQDSFIVEVFKFSILALIIVVPFRMFIAQPFIVSGASMAPTFATGEYLIVDQITYRFEPPKRGDVVIFRYPNDPSKFYIKRIIGLPGEVVELSNGNTVIVDPATDARVTLDEPYLKRDRTDDHDSTTLSSNEYYVMGDNRGASSDSREWGTVPRDNIVGRAFIRLLPPGQLSFMPGHCTYNNLLASSCSTTN